MKNMKNKYFSLIVIIILSVVQTFGQQEAMNTQYILNKLYVNPAYAGYKEQVNIVAMHRSQWIGFKGAPMTQTLAFDMPLKKDELAIGSTLIHDRIGPTTRLGITLDFAYRARLSNRATLAFGLKGGIDLYQNNLTDLALTSDYYNQVDEAFMYNTNGLMLPNAGFGLYYYKKDHFISLSVPKFLRNELELKGSTPFELLDGRQEPTLHLMAGKVWKINRQVKFQPNIAVRAVANAPVSLALYANVILYDQFIIGGFYSVQEVAGVIFQWQVDKKIRVGYAVDVPVSTLIRTNLGSHEIIASYTLSTKRKRIVYPRYF